MDDRNSAAYLREARHRSPAEFIRATALLFLQGCYAARERGDYHYDDVPENSDLAIVDNANEFLTEKETRPALVVTRGPLAWNDPMIRGDMQEETLQTATTKSGNLIQGSFSVSAVSRVDLESEKLASEVFSLFKMFRAMLCKHMGFHIIRPTQLSDTRLVEQAGYGKLWITTASIVCYLGDAWIIEPRELIPLQKIVMDYVFTHKGDDPNDPVLEVGTII